MGCSTFPTAIILGLCIVCAYLIKEYRFYYLPKSGAAILLGLIVGACTILLFAVLGTMASTFIIGFLTLYAGKVDERYLKPIFGVKSEHVSSA
ncbi:hypothetical protein ATCC90586_012188 [Pythium insidiosum]|nr:hypothetical protein ATCC90586_012188 [Pythium insidiosum]